MIVFRLAKNVMVLAILTGRSHGSDGETKAPTPSKWRHGALTRLAARHFSRHSIGGSRTCLIELVQPYLSGIAFLFFFYFCSKC